MALHYNWTALYPIPQPRPGLYATTYSLPVQNDTTPLDLKPCPSDFKGDVSNHGRSLYIFCCPISATFRLHGAFVAEVYLRTSKVLRQGMEIIRQAMLWHMDLYV